MPRMYPGTGLDVRNYQIVPSGADRLVEEVRHILYMIFYSTDRKYMRIDNKSF